jgi:gluconokinase
MSSINPPHSLSRAIIVMGVSGSGKSMLGGALASRLGWRFADADHFHPPENVEKMRQGHALNDADRAPWLARLNALLRHSVAKDQAIVLACSALKDRYRIALADKVPHLGFVHLHGSFELIAERMSKRKGHYMPTSLLKSQFEALEPPENVLVVPISNTIEMSVAQVLKQIEYSYS